MWAGVFYPQCSHCCWGRCQKITKPSLLNGMLSLHVLQKKTCSLNAEGPKIEPATNLNISSSTQKAGLFGRKFSPSRRSYRYIPGGRLLHGLFLCGFGKLKHIWLSVILRGRRLSDTQRTSKTQVERQILDSIFDSGYKYPKLINSFIKGEIQSSRWAKQPCLKSIVATS